jgi:hypothetical protein
VSRLFQVTDDDITTKPKFIAAIRRFLASGELPRTGDPDLDDDREYRASRGELLLVDAIAKYFEDHTEITDKDLGINWFVDLHKHLVEAFEEFRTHPKHQALRETYKSQLAGLNQEIPDLLDIRGGFAHGHVTYDLVKLMPRLAGRMGGSWLDADLKGYFNAQATVIDHAWRRFVRKCYRPIALRIKEERHRGNSGLFGRTTLRSYVLAGRIMFTFSRTSSVPDLLARLTEMVNTKDVTAENKVAALEALLMITPAPDDGPDVNQISFVGDDSDMYGFRSGMNYPYTDYAECVAMIDDVIDHWDPTKFVENGAVRLAGMP